jgi:TetR/AcrR family transcriptional regulator, repressor for uid operon
MSGHPDGGDPMRDRILQAAFTVLCRHGYGKFSLSDVAAQAGISRPTLYKQFRSRDELLSAFSAYEMRMLRADLTTAVQGSDGDTKLDAVLRFLVSFYRSHQPRGLIEIEPGLVLTNMRSALPALGELIAGELDGLVSSPEDVAMTLVRISVCHYLVPGSDEHRLLDQLRLAAQR